MKVFVSATSSDLRDARKLANRVLLTHDIQPVDQEHFAADERSLSDYLEASVGRSDAVVCLVGNVFGAAPGDEPDRSYTQLEYDFARLHNKPVFVFMTSESFSAPGINQTDESRLRQLEHRTRLLDQHKCEIFDDLHQLELALLHALPRLRSQCGDRPFLYRKPPVPPDVFIGRAEECGQLKNALNRNHPSAIAVVGIAGQGKTTLVQQVLRERLEQTHESGFWCTAHETEFTFDAFLDEVLQYLTDGQFDKLKMKEMRTRTTELLKHLQQKPSIIVLDSFEQWLKKPVQSTEREALKESRRATFQELDEFVSGASGLNSGSHLLLITRVVPAALDHVELSTIPVRNVAERNIGMEGLTPAASVELMRNLGVQGTEDELLQLAKTFAFHPLAIRVVAGYVFEEYGGLLTEMESLSDADPDKALECLVEQVQLNLPARQESVRLLQCVSCSLESPSVQTISEILSSDTEIGRKAGQSLRRLIAALSAYQLVQFDSCSQTIVVHPLIKKYFHDSLTSADKAEIHLRYSLHYESTELIEAPLTLNDMRPKRLALEHAILSRDPEICYRILFSQVMHSTPLVEWFSLHGHHSEGISLLTRIGEIESVNLKYRFQIPVSVYCLQLGRTKEAVAVLDQAIHYLEIVAEGNQEFTLELAVALMNRGQAYTTIPNYEQALKDSQRCVQHLESLPDPDANRSLQIARARNNLAILHREMGNTRLSISTLDQAARQFDHPELAIVKMLYPDYASIFVNRGNAYSDLYQSESAIEDYRFAENIYKILIELGRTELRAEHYRLTLLIASLYNQTGNPLLALSEVEFGLTGLESLVEQNASWMPALITGLGVRARAKSLLNQHESACQDAQRGVEECVKLIQAGREDLQGILAHRYLVNAICLFSAGNIALGMQQYQLALKTAKPMVNAGEGDVRATTIHYLLAMFDVLAGDQPDFAVQVINDCLQIAEEGMESKKRDDLLVPALQDGFARVSQLKQFQHKDFQRERLQKLQSLVVQKHDG